jgi:hypothetical protein
MKSVIVSLLIALVVFSGCVSTPASPYVPPSSAGAASGSPQPAAEAVFLPMVKFFWASPSMVEKGNPVTLKWHVYGADSVTIEPAVGRVAAIGSTTVVPAGVTTYTLTAVSRAGAVTAEESVQVIAPHQPAPHVSWFVANPSSIPRGSATTLSWYVSHADKVILSGYGAVPATGSIRVYPAGSMSYALEASNSSGMVRDNAVVEVLAISPDIYWRNYSVPVIVPSTSAPGGGGYSGADGQADAPSSNPGGGGYSGAGSMTPEPSPQGDEWPEPPPED